MERMTVHDKRLLGTPPPIVENTYDVDATVSIQHCVGWVAQHARDVGGLRELLIMCHGFEADWNMAASVCTGRPVGGFGLQLCREGLSLNNVILTRAWSGLIRRITVYACAPADTGAGNAGTLGDGRRFMGELALWSGVFVNDAAATEIYTYGPSSPIDFGGWEGPVLRFDPGTGAGARCFPGAMR